MSEQVWLTLIATAGPILVTVAVGLAVWLKARAAVLMAQAAVIRADASHAVVGEIKVLAQKTEEQTNDRLSKLDAKVADHERRCAESKAQIAELKLLLAEALSKLRPIVLAPPKAVDEGG